MERYIRLLMLIITMMFSFININQTFAASTATSFQLPLTNYPVDDGCRQWEWYGDFNGDGSNEYHLADDACAPSGTNVYAVANGTVMYAGSYTDCPNWGYLIIIEHTLPDGSKVNSIYGHIAPISGISTGMEVTKGQYIGNIVSMDCWDDHIHFGIYVGSFTNIACYGPGNCLTSGYGSSTGNYVDPVDFINDHQSTCSTTTSSNAVHLMTVEPQSNGKYTIYGYQLSGSGNSATLSGNYWSYQNTGNQTTTFAWLSGDVNGDGYDDVVQTRYKSGYTYAQVYLSGGTGGLNTQTQWKKTSGQATKAFLVDMNDDHTADLILGFPNSDSTMTWKYYTSDGSTRFEDAVTWNTSFGKESDVFVVGDFNGNGKAELLRGRESDGSTGSNFSSPLIWKRLDTSGNDSTVLSSFGYSGDDWFVINVDNDSDSEGYGTDELVRIDRDDSTVVPYVATYNTSSQTFNTTTSYANDVGGPDAEYFAYAIDYLDGYPDLMRFDGSDLKLMQSSGGTAFEEQGNQSTLVSGINTNATFLFGDYGDSTSTSESCVSALSLDGDVVDPVDDETSDNDGLIDEDVTPEDQYVFFDYDGNGDDDPCVRRGTGLLCLYDGLYGTWTVPGEVIGTGEYLITREGRTSYYDYAGADGIADYVLVYGETWADEFLYWHHTIVARFGNQLQIDRNLDGVMDTYLYYGAGNTEDGYYLADLNGDGYADFIVRRGNLFYVDSTSDGAADYWFTYGSTSLDSQWYFADFDGDGVDGILVIRGDVLTVVDTITPNQSNAADWVMAYGFGLAD